MSNLLDKTTLALQVAGNMRQLRNNVITSNIANAETPGYAAKKLDFENALARAVDLEGVNKEMSLESGHFPVSTGSLSRVRADVYENPDASINNDGNTVDLEREMSALAENSTMYKAAIQLMNKKLAALKYAASDGGR